jgi:hypothetical protein
MHLTPLVALRIAVYNEVEFLEALRALGLAVKKASAVNGFGAADGYAEAGEGEEENSSDREPSSSSSWYSVGCSRL